MLWGRSGNPKNSEVSYASLRAKRSNPEITVKRPAVYIVTNFRNGALYTGVTSNLVGRIYQHKQGDVDGFTKRYGCKLLVWFEMHETMESSIVREKLMKAGSRKKKLAQIESMNPTWRDLFEEII